MELDQNKTDASNLKQLKNGRRGKSYNSKITNLTTEKNKFSCSVKSSVIKTRFSQIQRLNMKYILFSHVLSY